LGKEIFSNEKKIFVNSCDCVVWSKVLTFLKSLFLQDRRITGVLKLCETASEKDSPV
jgi:hypothetical protein